MNKNIKVSVVKAIKTLLLLVFCLQFVSRNLVGLQQDRAPTSSPFGTLKWVWAGDGRASDGTFLGMNIYETPDGTKVSITRGKLRSSKVAEKELKLWMKSTAIANKTSKRDDSGRIVGTRAEVSFSTATSKAFAIVWTEGEKFVWISSFSMPLCRHIAAQMNPGQYR